jgi:hypothetical protein
MGKQCETLASACRDPKGCFAVQSRLLVLLRLQQGRRILAAASECNDRQGFSGNSSVGTATVTGK